MAGKATGDGVIKRIADAVQKIHEDEMRMVDLPEGCIVDHAIVFRKSSSQISIDLWMKKKEAQP